MQQELVIDGIHGPRTDPGLAERLHQLSHQGVVETLQIAPHDLPRRRFRAVTDRGTACFVALARSEQLFDGAVLHLDDKRAVVVRVGEQRWLRLQAGDTAAALELGYHAGNLHWRIRFDGDALLVAADGPDQTYLARVRALVDQRPGAGAWLSLLVPAQGQPRCSPRCSTATGSFPGVALPSPGGWKPWWPRVA